MMGRRIRPVAILAASLVVSVLAVLGGRAIYAQDTGQAKYSVRVPNGLAFSEFRGYERWQTVAISQNEKLIAVILANPVMINAYQSGIPGNGELSPTVPRWRRSTGTRKRTRRSPIRHAGKPA